MKKEIKAIIFDMGGVILRTIDETPRMELAGKLGVSIEVLKDEVFFSDSAIRSEEGYLNKYDHWKNVLRKFGINNPVDLKEYDEKFWSGDSLDQRLVEYLLELKKGYSLGLISNAFKGARDWIESHYHFMRYFDFSIFSYEIRLRKPDAKIYHYACRKLQVEPEECVFVDDMLVNVEGARAAGLYAIQFQDKDQLEFELEKIISLIHASRNPDSE